ncbi:MAG: MerR family transcriptional regulator, partial [Phycisphaerales bacterium]
MSKRSVPNSRPPMAIELFQPKPDVLYSLDATAHLAGVSRRSILIYCRTGLVQPVVQPPYGVMEFTEEAIYTLRRIEHLRTVHGLDLSWIKTL